MKLVRTSMLVSAMALVMALSLPNTVWADWTAVLEWSKVVVAGGGLSYSDEGPFRCYYDDHKLTRIEFYDWNGDATGVSIDVSGRSHLNWFGEDGSYFGVTTVDDTLTTIRFALYDRSGNTVLEWTNPDSLNPNTGFMPCGTGRFLTGERKFSIGANLRAYEPDGSLVCSVTLDSTDVSWLSADGARLHVPIGVGRVWPPSGPPLAPRLHVYDVDACALLYTLPASRYQYHARDVDVIAVWKNEHLTIYYGGVSQGSLGNVGAIGMSPNGQYLAGLTTPPNQIAAYRLDTMTQMWAIPDTADVGEQMVVPSVADNGVVLYGRLLDGGGFGVTIVAPTGEIFFVQDYPNGMRHYLGGNGSFFTIERYDDHVVSYYGIAEE